MSEKHELEWTDMRTLSYTGKRGYGYQVWQSGAVWYAKFTGWKETHPTRAAAKTACESHHQRSKESANREGRWHAGLGRHMGSGETMTNQKNLRLAELLGWTGRGPNGHQPVPDYCHDLNVVREVETSYLTHDQSVIFHDRLQDATDEVVPFSATAEQRVDALIATLEQQTQ